MLYTHHLFLSPSKRKRDRRKRKDSTKGDRLRFIDILYVVLAKQNHRPFIIAMQYIFLTQIWFGECSLWLLKVKNSCCVFREFLTFYAYKLNLSYQIWVKFFCIPEILKNKRLKPGFVLYLWKCTNQSNY